MAIKREKREELEDYCLAPYGIRSKESKGREFPDDEPIYRTAFQRDRDRILHTTAFNINFTLSIRSICHCINNKIKSRPR